jgi:hypothetical protein
LQQAGVALNLILIRNLGAERIPLKLITDCGVENHETGKTLRINATTTRRMNRELGSD